MAKISEYKMMNVDLGNGKEYSIQVSEDPKESFVIILGAKFPIKELKELVDAFTDRYPFAFAEEIASDATDGPSKEE
jgi:hypothetical protein